ncbi:MAG: TraB/GumN family protein [Vicinamibacterales bacterium]
MAFRRARIPALVVALLCAASTLTSAQARNFLWRVEANGRVLHLAGSVHALPQSAYPLPAAFQRAFDASGTLVEEIDLSEAGTLTALPLLMAKGMYSDGRTFEQSVSPETAALVRRRLAAVPGMSELLQPMEPWVVALMLTALQVQTAGLDTAIGLDQHFFDQAKSSGKAVVGLETAESQLDIFDRMPPPVQEQMLRSTLDDLDAGPGELQAIVAAWRAGDTATIERQMLGGLRQLPGAYQSLIVNRNRAWMPKIEACFAQPRPCFVVVGAAHLVGPDGLLALLQARGYRITQQ